MYLLYLDESGNENDPNDRFFVLGGIALHEKQPYFLSKAIDQVQEKHFPNHQPIAFHASEIRAGRNLWRKVPVEKRQEILVELCRAILTASPKRRVLYATAVEKSRDMWGEAAIEKATEQICRRFDIFLQRNYIERDDAQRGLIVFSEGRFDARAKMWVRNFHRQGTSWGAINNLADIPYFASTRESRLLQMADLIAHATWLMYERRDPTLFKHLVPCFDSKDGILHGLTHVQADDTVICECPACLSRRTPSIRSPWLD